MLAHDRKGVNPVSRVVAALQLQIATTHNQTIRIDFEGGFEIGWSVTLSLVRLKHCDVLPAVATQSAAQCAASSARTVDE